MDSYRVPDEPIRRPITTQLLAIAFALLLVFLANLLSLLLPPRLLDPSWQLRFCGLMAENGVLPLMALGLVFLASYLDPVNDGLRTCRVQLSRLAGLAAMGFLLLIPLQLAALALNSSSLDQRQQLQRNAAAERLATIQKAIANASNSADLNQRLQNLQAPPLPPSERDLPLPQLRSLLSQRLQQTRALIQRQFSRPPRLPLSSLLLQALRGVLSNFGYAVAFSACSVGRKQQRSMLQNLIDVLTQLMMRRRAARQPVLSDPRPGGSRRWGRR